MESDQKHLTALTNIPPKSTSSETSSSESSSSETSSSESSASSESSSSESSSSESSTSELSSSETSSSESSSSDSDIDEIVNMIKHQRIRERLAQRKDSILGKVDLHIDFNDDEKQKSIPSEFIVVGPDWPDHFPDLTLGMPWLRENGAKFEMSNSLFTIDDNFAIPFKEVPMQYPEQ